MVLSHSHAMYARFALDQTLESFVRGHVEAFRALGGVPRVLLYDNLKSVVLERAGEHVRYHPRILELAGHYHLRGPPDAYWASPQHAPAFQESAMLSEPVRASATQWICHHSF